LDEAAKHIPDLQGEIIELQCYTLNPCTACSGCKDTKRCAIDAEFNQIYEKIIACDVLILVVPHYALAPAKFCMLLEKMGQIVSIHSSKDKTYQSETFGLPTAIITHGATAVNEAAKLKKKRIINDPIAVALSCTQVKVIPFDGEWGTGICVQPIEMNRDGETRSRIDAYVRVVMDNLL